MALDVVRLNPVPKPEAVRLVADADWDEIAAWCGGHVRQESTSPGAEPEAWIERPGLNPRSEDRAYEGDWVLKVPCEDGPEFWFLTDEELNENYEAV